MYVEFISRITLPVLIMTRKIITSLVYFNTPESHVYVISKLIVFLESVSYLFK
jgi:hypothetical protein